MRTWVEAGSLVREHTKKTREMQPSSHNLPSTLKNTLKETNFGSLKEKTQLVKKNKFSKRNGSVSHWLPKQMQLNVEQHLKPVVYTSESGFTVKYHHSPDGNEGAFGFYKRQGDVYSLVTLNVRKDRLTQVTVNCSERVLSRLLKEDLPKELKAVLEFAKESM